MSASRSQVRGETPFWMDYSVPYPMTQSTTRILTAWIAVLMGAYRFMFYTSTLVLLVILSVAHPWLWPIVVIWAGILVLDVLAVRRGARLRKRIKEVQQRAKLQTGALQIGSALHTAGHPLLKVDEPVVLAIKARELSIYNYGSPIPLDSINLEDIESVETVVYDDERVPHVGVADNTAQALQLSFLWRGKRVNSVFRRMHGVRAIEWYQAIEAARLTNGD